MTDAVHWVSTGLYMFLLVIHVEGLTKPFRRFPDELVAELTKPFRRFPDELVAELTKPFRRFPDELVAELTKPFRRFPDELVAELTKPFRRFPDELVATQLYLLRFVLCRVIRFMSLHQVAAQRVVNI